MYTKTSSPYFFKYGNSISDERILSKLYKECIIIEEKTTQNVKSYNSDIYIKTVEGMAILIIFDDNISTFVIHRTIRIFKHTTFAILPISNVALYELYTSPKTKSIISKLSTPYTFKNIKTNIYVTEINAIYYGVKERNYVFSGERHHLYELTFVDNGSLLTKIDHQEYTLDTNECILYYPGQFHNQRVISNHACSYITIIFECRGIENEILKNKKIMCNREQIQLLQAIAKNSENDFAYKNALLITELQLLLIKLLTQDAISKNVKPTSLVNQKWENSLLNKIVDYIDMNLFDPLPVESICDAFAISRSSLQNLFKNNANTSPKHYINEKKLAYSRLLIKNGDLTISDISAKLGFTSIHYFSRKFKKRYGITPSEYARKIYE